MKAYELLATPDKWVKGSWGAYDGRRCLYTAITAVYERDELPSCMARVLTSIAVLYPSWRLRQARVLVCSEACQECYATVLELAQSYVVEFNDSLSTTHEDVLRVCKVADV